MCCFLFTRARSFSIFLCVILTRRLQSKRIGTYCTVTTGSRKKKHFKLKTTFSAINHGPLKICTIPSHHCHSIESNVYVFLCVFFLVEHLMISSLQFIWEALRSVELDLKQCATATFQFPFLILEFSHIFFSAALCAVLCVLDDVASTYFYYFIWTDLQISLELLLQLSLPVMLILWILFIFSVARYPDDIREYEMNDRLNIFSSGHFYLLNNFARQMKWHEQRFNNNDLIILNWFVHIKKKTIINFYDPFI